MEKLLSRKRRLLAYTILWNFFIELTPQNSNFKERSLPRLLVSNSNELFVWIFFEKYDSLRTLSHWLRWIQHYVKRIFRFAEYFRNDIKKTFWMILLYGLGVHEDNFIIFGVHRAQKVKNNNNSNNNNKNNNIIINKQQQHQLKRSASTLSSTYRAFLKCCSTSVSIGSSPFGFVWERWKLPNCKRWGRSGGWRPSGSGSTWSQWLFSH